jgi:hypothetical protein
MTDDLRRLWLHGLIERVPRFHPYRITELGARIAHLRPIGWNVWCVMACRHAQGAAISENRR